MNVLITAGPTREPIDPVRYIGNRSSGAMGAALAEATAGAGHVATLILGPVAAEMPAGVRRIDVETSQQMQDAVLREFPRHDLLIMAAAVADFRPASVRHHKLPRGPRMTVELEPTDDILAAAGAIKQPQQRTVGFSLVARDDLERSRQKLLRKHVDLLVHNPIETMSSQSIEATLLYPDGREERLPPSAKRDFAAVLLQRCQALFMPPRHASS